MNTLLLDPTDVLFFRDGRPMGGSSTGRGDAWPLPNVTNAALHAALWRAGLESESHAHHRKVGSTRTQTAECFGSLVTAGPFPVCANGRARTWFFPRPLDAICKPDVDTDGRQTGSGKVLSIAAPMPNFRDSASSNPLPYPAASLVPPSKDSNDPWWSEGAFANYLESQAQDADSARILTRKDSDFSDSEAAIGIGIDTDTGTQDGSRFYSAHYLRICEGWRLGLLAATREKTDVHGERADLIDRLFQESGRLLVGGQQRLCTVEKVPGGSRLPLPIGRSDGFPSRLLPDSRESKNEYLVKWVLLSPAIFPSIEAGEQDGVVIHPHSGGWLPNWIEDRAGHRVMLKTPLEPRDVARESREKYRERVRSAPGIKARLVAAIVGKPLAVTGWSLGTPGQEEEASTYRRAGAKPAHLAVPAGSVYYFACATADDARALAAALNWHGAPECGPSVPLGEGPATVTAAASAGQAGRSPHEGPGASIGTTIKNRRSTLFGEKGFGLGVCGTWDFHPSAESP